MTENQTNPEEMPPPEADQRSEPAGDPVAYQPAFPGPAAPVKEKGGFARGFGLGAGLGLGLTVALIALSVVGGLLSMISLGVMLASTDGDATTQTEVIWGDESAEGRLRAIPISGSIMTDGASGGLLAAGTYGYEVADQIDDLTTDDSAGLVLLVNTPGGTIAGSKAIADAIERYQDRTGQPVLVHVQGMSASGGVYSTAPADEIIADHGSLVGSIGVIYGPFEQYEDVVAMGDILQGVVQTTGGITQEYITAGEGKDFGNPFRPITDEERTIFQQGIDNEYDNFVNHVAEHRGIDAETIVNSLGAHVFDPVTAEANGLIDGTMGRPEFFRHAAEAAGIDPESFAVDQILPPTGWASLFGIHRAHGTALPLEARAGKEAVVNQSFCDPATPLVFAGDIQAVCGR